MIAPDVTSDLITILEKSLPSKYQNIRYFCNGGTRQLFIAEWGPGKEKRIIKVDRIIKVENNTISPRAKRHVERGCDTENEITALTQIENPDSHNIARLCDYFDLQDDHNLTLSVESYYESKSLEELITEKGGLKEDKFVKIFNKVICGVKHTIKSGLLHRDLKPSNILILENDEVRITDYANAKKIEELRSSYLPTMGGHFIIDPLTISGIFNGEKNAYTTQSEIYALGVDMYYALTGKYIFEIDPDKRFAKVNDSGKSFLDHQGNYNFNLYNKSLKKALQDLKGNQKKFKKIIDKCLTLDQNKRYESIDELLSDFEKKTKKNKSHLSRIAFATFLTTMITFPLGISYYINYANQRLEEKVTEAKKYQVAAEWNGGKVEINNNFVELEVQAYNYDPKNPKKTDNNYPLRKEYIYADPGDIVHINVVVKDSARPNDKYLASPMVKGKVYLEGFKTEEEFYVTPRNHDESTIYDMYPLGITFQNINISEDLKQGNYNIIIEIYSPTNEEIKRSHGNKNFNFLNPKKVIAQKRIPLMVGETNDFNIKSLHLSNWESRFSICRLNNPYYQNTIDPEIEYEIAIPEEEIKKTLEKPQFKSNCYSPSFGMLNESGNQEDKTLQIVGRKDGKIVFYSFFPIKRDYYYQDKFQWALALPTEEFSKKIIEYKEKLFQSQN